MKKILAILTLTGIASAAFAQGVINANNTGGTAITLSSNSVSMGNISGAGSYYFAVYNNTTYPTAAPATTAASILGGAWTFTGVYATNTSAGRISDGPGTGATTAPGTWAIGTTAWTLILGWSANYGAPSAGTLTTILTDAENGTWGQNGWFGTSVVGYAEAGGVDPVSGQTINPTALFGATSPGIQSFPLDFVSVVPEPGTFALAGLGAAAMLIFRRRK